MSTAASIENFTSEAAPSNRFGLAGFVVSILGILTLGVLSPIALLLSVIGLRKTPRGFAIAGTALGSIGTALLVALAYAGYLLALFAGPVFAEFAVSATNAVVSPLMNAADLISADAAKSGVLPKVEQGNRLIAGLRDHTGHPLRYETDGQSFQITTQVSGGPASTKSDIRIAVTGPERRIVTSGPDGEFGTADDSRSDPLPAAPAAP